MELSKEEYIKLKQKEYYLSKYKKNDAKMKNIYSSACARIRETINKYNLNIKFSYFDMLGCTRNEFKQHIYF